MSKLHSIKPTHPPLHLRVAILDMNNGHRNIGVRNIQRIVTNFAHSLSDSHPHVSFKTERFHVRDKNEVPDLSFDFYISSGGPGSPLEDDGTGWEKAYFKLLDQLIEHNLSHADKKYFFGICHSFQTMAKKFNIAKIDRREKRKLGVVPIFKTTDGKNDPMFEGLLEKFYAFDNRDWQVFDPDMRQLKNLNARILSYEEEDHRIGKAITGIRYSDEMESVQFHPEAERDGILIRFTDPDEKLHIIEILGKKEYEKLIQSLNNPRKLLRTYKTILPGFLVRSFNGMSGHYGLEPISRDLKN
ncbi:GMP synthase [bacterium]|nr:GMP synthase [bacterium]